MAGKKKVPASNEPGLLRSVREFAESLLRVNDIVTREGELGVPRTREDGWLLMGTRAMALESVFPNDIYTIWASWVLERAGLPAAADHGLRTVTIMGRTRTERGTKMIRLRRVADRFPYNSPEHWAGRLASAVQSGHFEIEGEKFIREVELMIVADDVALGKKKRHQAAEFGRLGGGATKGTGFKAAAERLMLAVQEARPNAGPSDLARRVRKAAAKEGLIVTQNTAEKTLRALRKEGSKD